MTRSPSSSPAVDRVPLARRRSRAPLALATVAGTTALLGAATVATLCRFPEIWREEARSTAVFRVQSRSMEPAFLGPRFVWRCPKCGEPFATTLDVDSSGGVRSFDGGGRVNGDGGGETSSNSASSPTSRPNAPALNANSPEVRKFQATARFFPCPRCGFDRVPASSAVFQDGALVEATAPRFESRTARASVALRPNAPQTPTPPSVSSVPNNPGGLNDPDAAEIEKGESRWSVWRRRLERLWSGATPELRPERWDVVVFRAPAGRATLKRVVGLPGEKVEIVNGDVFVDGRVAPRSLEQIAATAFRLDSTRILRTDDRLTVVATTPIWNDAPVDSLPSADSPASPRFPSAPPLTASEFPQTIFKPTPIFNESPTPRWNGDDVAPVEPVRDFVFDFSWSNADGTPTRFQLLARRPNRVFLLDFDAERTIALRSLRLADGRTGAGRAFEELSAADFAESPVERVRWSKTARDGAPETAVGAESNAATRFRVYLVDGELILTREGAELARFSTGDAASDAVEPVAAPFALLGDVARAFAPVLRRDLHYSNVAEAPKRSTAGPNSETPNAAAASSDAPRRYFLLGDNSPASLDSRFAAFGTVDADALLFRVAPSTSTDVF